MSVSLVKDQDWQEIRAYWFGFAVRQGFACTDACAELAEDYADRGLRVRNVFGAAADLHEINARIIAERA